MNSFFFFSGELIVNRILIISIVANKIFSLLIKIIIIIITIIITSFIQNIFHFLTGLNLSDNFS